MSDDFRIVSVEIVDDPISGRPARLSVCEEYVPESDRWEPFVSIQPLPQQPLPLEGTQ
jgi:hypothetical protein